MKSRSSCNKTELALPYHAGLSDEERAANQTRFIRDDANGGNDRLGMGLTSQMCAL